MGPEDTTGQRRSGRSGPAAGPRLGAVVRFESRRLTPAWDRPARRLRKARAPGAASTPDNAAERLETLHRQASALTHDFNNLLGVIVSASEALAEQLDAGSEQQTLAQVSLKAAEQGAELLRRLLDLAQETPAAAVNADCGEAVEAAARFARHAIPAAVELTVRPGPEALSCAADGSDLESALLNLCINAGDAICGHGSIAIETRGAFLSREAGKALELAPGPYVRISVIDDGEGMSPQTLARAVEPFFTTKRGVGGTGLGLAGVDAFARRCGGRLLLVSQEGAGTTATLYLPRVVTLDS